MYLEEKDYDRSDFYLTRAIEIFPENERYLLALTGCHIGLDKREMAFETAKKGMMISPGNFLDSFEILSKKLGRGDEYIETLEKIAIKDGGKKFPLLTYKLAIFLKEAKKADLAEIWFDKVIKVFKAKILESPSNWENYLWLGEAFGEMGKSAESLENFRIAREFINEKQFPARVAFLDRKMAELHTMIGRYDDAIRILRQLIKRYPSEPEYLRELGINLARKGSSKKAEIYLEKALGLAERDPLTLYYTAIINCEMKNISRSVKFLKNAVAIDSTLMEKARSEKMLAPLFAGGLIDNIMKREELDRKFRHFI
jgi:tetratricopeptide (TPR) repeat protein